MSTLTVTFPPISQLGSGLGRAAASLIARLQYARKQRETRRYLEQMDDHMLQDLGVSRAQALFELDRPTVGWRPND